MGETWSEQTCVLPKILEPGDDESKIAESVDDHEHGIGMKETDVSEELAVNEKTMHLGEK